ncbi:MAG: 2-amino-4-hydroxy-6-hydroxymethyldihydropteridine diphosphokinase [Bdellovibrionota bacterium]
MDQLLIALGSNLGTKKKNLEIAKNLIVDQVGKILATSNEYITEPVGAADQKFLNAVILIETHHSPLECLESLLKIEQEMGRVRKERWGNRNIDLDILLWRDKSGAAICHQEARLTIPHQHMHKRLFVLDPACDIAPEWIHPVLHLSLNELRLKLLQ